MYNFMIYIIFIVIVLAFEIFVISWKKLAFQDRNSRGSHFGMSRNNLPKLSVNVLYTCRKLFDFNRIFYSHDSFQESFCLKLLLKKP